MNGLGPSRTHRIARALQKRRSFCQWQSHHIGKTADHTSDKHRRQSLNGVATGFSLPFTTGEIGFMVLMRKTFEAKPCFNEPRLDLSIGMTQGHTRHHPMPAP
jgi:hypothetical protein